MDSISIAGTEYRIYDELYAVSACGKFLRQLQPYEPKLRPDGYLSVGRQKLAHRMVASLWCDQPNGANTVHHINHIKTDNRSVNLQWVHAYDHMRDHHAEVSKGHLMSDAGKASLRAYRLGKATSDETKQKQREATLRLGLKPPVREVGYKMSNESKRKTGLNQPHRVHCEIRGVIYSSFADASQATGEKRATLRKRCLSPNFPDYKIRS